MGDTEMEEAYAELGDMLGPTPFQAAPPQVPAPLGPPVPAARWPELDQEIGSRASTQRSFKSLLRYFGVTDAAPLTGVVRTDKKVLRWYRSFSQARFAFHERNGELSEGRPSGGHPQLTSIMKVLQEQSSKNSSHFDVDAEEFREVSGDWTHLEIYACGYRKMAKLLYFDINAPLSPFSFKSTLVYDRVHALVTVWDFRKRMGFRSWQHDTFERGTDMPDAIRDRRPLRKRNRKGKQPADTDGDVDMTDMDADDDNVSDISTDEEAPAGTDPAEEEQGDDDDGPPTPLPVAIAPSSNIHEAAMGMNTNAPGRKGAKATVRFDVNRFTEDPNNPKQMWFLGGWVNGNTRENTQRLLDYNGLDWECKEKSAADTTATDDSGEPSQAFEKLNRTTQSDAPVDPDADKFRLARLHSLRWMATREVNNPSVQPVDSDKAPSFYADLIDSKRAEARLLIPKKDEDGTGSTGDKGVVEAQKEVFEQAMHGTVDTHMSAASCQPQDYRSALEYLKIERRTNPTLVGQDAPMLKWWQVVAAAEILRRSLMVDVMDRIERAGNIGVDQTRIEEFRTLGLRGVMLCDQVGIGKTNTFAAARLAVSPFPLFPYSLISPKMV
jgi:hypothetical protein